MRVRCIKIVHQQTGETVPEYPGVRVGSVCTVLEMITGPDYWMIRVLDEDDEDDDPGSLWDPEMFETIDAQVPPSWTLVLQDGHMRLASALWQRPGFWNDYFDKVPQALADFRTAKHELLNSA